MRCAVVREFVYTSNGRFAVDRNFEYIELVSGRVLGEFFGPAGALLGPTGGLFGFAGGFFGPLGGGPKIL